MAVKLTERAAEEVKRFRQEHNFDNNMVLRIGVAGGGCSGFNYTLNFDDNNDGDFTDIINVSGDIGMDYLAAAYARFVWPISDRFDISARGGYAYTQLNGNAVTPGGNTFEIAEDAEDGFTAGAGLTFDLTENLELRADYTWFGFDEVDADSATLAVGFKF